MERLFDKHEDRQFEARAVKKTKDSLVPTRLDSETELREFVDRLAATNEIEFPRFRKTEGSIDSGRTSSERLIFNIPFSGEKEVMNIVPSTRTIPPPMGTLAQGQLQLEVTIGRGGVKEAQAELQATFSEIEVHLSRLEHVIKRINSHVRAAIEETARGWYEEQRKRDMIRDEFKDFKLK